MSGFIFRLLCPIGGADLEKQKGRRSDRGGNVSKRRGGSQEWRGGTVTDRETD